MKLVSIPANPAPEDAVSGTVKTPDGVNLRYARWLPPPSRKGTVCLFQGRAEFIEKYFETVRDLRARGFAVATIDWRGQGLSDRVLADRQRGHVRDFYQYGIDLDSFMEQVVLPDCPPPIFAAAKVWLNATKGVDIYCPWNANVGIERQRLRLRIDTYHRVFLRRSLFRDS